MSKCDVNDVQKEDAALTIKVTGGDQIRVDKYLNGTEVEYRVNYVEYSPPIISTSNDAGIVKVGITIPLVTFNGLITPGSKPITSRSMVPDKGLDLTAAFQWTEENVVGTAPGLWPKFSGSPVLISASDGTTPASKQAGVDVRSLFYVGFSTKATLVEADIKLLELQTLDKSIFSRYSEYTYNKSDLTRYLYWVFPKSTAGFTSAAEGPLPVPLKLDHADVVITDEGIAQNYRVIRTSTKSKFVNAVITIE